MWGHGQDVGRVSAALVDGGGEAWVALVKVEPGTVELQLAPTQAGAFRGEGEDPGPDLSGAFESGGRLTLRHGGAALVLEADALAGDRSEPYLWEADGRALIDAVGESAGARLVLEAP